MTIAKCHTFDGQTHFDALLDHLDYLSDRPDSAELAYHQAHLIHREVLMFGFNAEAKGFSRESIIQRMTSVRSRFSESSLLAYMQQWPKGYEGDFEIIERLLNGENRSAPGTAGFFLEAAALQTSPSRQHSEKVRWQAEQVGMTVRECQQAAILSLACGGARDMAIMRQDIIHNRATVALNDIDAEALTLASRRLYGVHTEVYPINVITFLRKPPDSRFDLTLAGGLFDYLPDRMAVFAMRQIWKLMKDGGRFCFTNIRRPNPYRTWMEYAVNWHLIERNEDDVRLLISSAGIPISNVTIAKDWTGLALLIEVIR